MLPEPLQSFVFVRRQLNATSASGGKCKGKVALNAGVIAALRDLAKVELIDDAATLAGKTVYLDSLKDNTEGELEIVLAPFALRKAGYIYFEKFDELIVQHRAVPPDKPFYIHSLEYFSAAGYARPSQIECYDDVTNLINFLASIADVAVREGQDSTLHLFVKTPLEIPVKYTAAELRTIPTLTAFVAKFRQPETRDQQAQILKATLCERLKGESKEKRFTLLLASWEAVAENFENNYKLYLHNFSWEKLRGEIEKEKFELSKKISAAVSEIQTKLVAIPAAFILTATQIVDSDGWIKNVLILVGTVVFSVLLEFLLNNQRRYLNNINKECDAVQNRLVREYPTIVSIAEDWKNLKEDSSKQKRALNWISIFNWSVPVAAAIHILIVFFK